MIENPIGASAQVFSLLQTKIVTGELRPNEPLIEVDLAEKLSVSRTPIRESLQRLAAIGMIVPRRRGWAVREYTPEEALRRSEVRLALEGFAAMLAATRATDDQLERCHQIHLDRLSVEPEDDERRVSTNRDFHNAIIDAAGNEQLKQAIYETGRFYLNGTVVRATTKEEMALGHAEHERIVTALLARDADAAERAMRAHIGRTFEMYQRLRPIVPSPLG